MNCTFLLLHLWRRFKILLLHVTNLLATLYKNFCFGLLRLHSGNSNERQFLKDFVGAVPGSSGERLACWLQPDSRLDPNKCELKAIGEPVLDGWPTQLTIITRDQYGDTVYVPNLKVCLCHMFLLYFRRINIDKS